MSKNDEYNLCKEITKYLTLQYPNVLFHWDYSGIRLTIGQATKMKQLNTVRGYPDLFIAQPKYNMLLQVQYSGLFIEVKRDGEKILKKNCSFISPHVEEQDNYLTMLTMKGYKAVFGIGFKNCKEIIDNYLK